MENCPENSIHVTGFGVFRGFTSTNPSWEAVKQLPDHIVHNGGTISIVKHQVSVTYEAVDKKIHEIWSKKPKVSGSHSFKNHLLPFFPEFYHGSSISYFSSLYTVALIETRIKFVWSEMHSMENSIKLILQINFWAVAMLHCPTAVLIVSNCVLHWMLTASSKKLIWIQRWCNVQIILASKLFFRRGNCYQTMALRVIFFFNLFSYLCGYMYLKSLDVDKKRSLFIHVPPPNDKIDIAKMSQVISGVINHCVKQLDENSDWTIFCEIATDSICRSSTEY